MTVRVFALMLVAVVATGCGGGGSDGSNNISGARDDSGANDPKPSISISANPSLIVAGNSTTLTWIVSDADSCSASGAWSGDKNTSGSEMTGPLSSNSTYILTCSGAGGSATRSVTVSVVATNGARVVGSVDSGLIDREGINRVYIFTGDVTPDDADGDSGDAVATALVNQDNGVCTWSFESSTLAAGEYTLAFTNQADVDEPGRDDAIIFTGTRRVTISGSPVIQEFVPASIIRVGPGRAYPMPSAAEQVANDGDVIEIDAGSYLDDIVVWRQDNLTLRGIGGRAHLKATQVIPYTSGNDQENGKAIWVTRGSNILVENIEFSGAAVPDENGAGIRPEGYNLTVCNGYFHDNENGILGGGGTLLIEYSEFANNGFGDGQTHNIYVDGADKLIFQHNYSHHAKIGHNLKTRASENYILYNRIMDEVDGTSSYAIDIPNGGLTYIIGNLIQQGVDNDNSTLISYGAEGLSGGRTHNLFVVNNTMVNDYGSGAFFDVASGTASAKIINNIFTGGGRLMYGAGDLVTNIETSAPGFNNIDAFDYQLAASSPARNAGSDPAVGNGFDLTPVYHYMHKAGREMRPSDDSIDVGAYEYVP